MAHNRTAIRDALLTLLSGMVTPVAVYAERRQRIDSTLRPLAIIALGDDAADAGEMAMGAGVYEVEHVQTVTLELHAEAADGETVCETIDQMELEAETLLASDLTLGGLAEIIYPIGSEIETSTDQDRVIGVRSVTYSIPWRAAFGSPDTPES